LHWNEKVGYDNQLGFLLGNNMGKHAARRPAPEIHLEIKLAAQQGDWDEHGQTS
jgi:hypothetical protein